MTNSLKKRALPLLLTAAVLSSMLCGCGSKANSSKDDESSIHVAHTGGMDPGIEYKKDESGSDESESASSAASQADAAVQSAQDAVDSAANGTSEKSTSSGSAAKKSGSTSGDQSKAAESHASSGGAVSEQRHAASSAAGKKTSTEKSASSQKSAAKTSSQASKQAASKQAASQAPKQAASQAPKQAASQAPKQAASQAPKQAASQAPKQAASQAPKQTTTQTTTQTASQAPKQEHSAPTTQTSSQNPKQTNVKESSSEEEKTVSSEEESSSQDESDEDIFDLSLLPGFSKIGDAWSWTDPFGIFTFEFGGGDNSDSGNKNSHSAETTSRHEPVERDDTSVEFAQEVLRLCNIERENNGVPPLELDDTICQAAQLRAGEIVTEFSHTRPDGRECFTALDEFGVAYMTSGENIAAGQTSPESVVNAWMNSPGHRANILNENYGKLGVGYVYDDAAEYRHYWVQMFTD